MRHILLSMSVIAVFFSSHSYAEEMHHNMPSEAQMQKMMMIGTPSDAHKVLESLVGKWTYKMSFRTSPDMPEQMSSGESENQWILGGRQLKQNFSGAFDMGGQTHAYNGIGYIGHDNLKNKYTSIWMDNMTTATMIAHGTYNAETKTITETGAHTCAMQGKEVKFKSEMKIIDADHYSYIMHDLSSADKPFKSMDIQFTRQK